MIVLKILFVLISCASSYFCAKELQQLPREELNPRQNLKRISWCSILPLIVDFLLFGIIGSLLIPEGTYGTGIELIALGVVTLAWSFLWLPTTIKLKKRIKIYYDTVEHNIHIAEFRGTNPYDVILTWLVTLIVKWLFTLTVTIWIVEV